MGPRPLPQHLMLALSLWGNSAIAWPALKGAWRLSMAGTKMPASEKALNLAGLLVVAGLDPERLDENEIAAALTIEGHRRLGEFLDGTLAYRRHPYWRRLPERPEIWRQGTTSLRDYRVAAGETASADAPRLLIIPSLVNRYYILDLMEEQSFLADLGRRGFSPFVVDWDAPGEAERRFALADYIARLEGALAAVAREPGGPIIPVGYCMGGMLALALALRAERRIAGLVLLATPWDFHAGEAADQARLIGAIGARLDPLIGALGELPVDLLQSLFALLDPVALLNKFRRFAHLAAESDGAKRFVALEDWLNDGTGLAARLPANAWSNGTAPTHPLDQPGGSGERRSNLGISDCRRCRSCRRPIASCRPKVRSPSPGPWPWARR
jgi:polyhydroxyalkanoate synthase